MKVTFKSVAIKQKKYPYIGISNSNPNLIVLFTSKDTGCVLNPGNTIFEVGKISTSWAEDKVFIPFNDPITLQND